MSEKSEGAARADRDGWRVERDSMGEMLVPADALWGAQTERSHENFPIGTERMPEEVVRAFALVKKPIWNRESSFSNSSSTTSGCVNCCVRTMAGYSSTPTCSLILLCGSRSV